MNVKCLALSLVLLVAAPLFAKGLSVGDAKRIDAEQGAYHPVLSEDGSKLLYTSEDYTGLMLMDMTTGESEVISDKIGAGDSPFFMNGTSDVCYKSVEFKGRLQYRTVEAYNMASKASDVVVNSTRERVTMTKGAKSATVLTDSKSNGATDLYAYTENGKIMVVKGGKSIAISPVEKANSYVWVSVSPSGDRLLFVEPYSGVYTSDLNGDNLVSYGRGDFPVWYGDDYIILAKCKDDGHVLLESRLYIVNVDTKSMVALTAADDKAHEASGSIEAGVVVYATDLGELFSVDIKVIE
ncbi:MAG: hypothetical protein R3Y22_03615 [Bacteroidales bacterium]